MNQKIKSLHFMGIGGSGMAGVAVLAKKRGYAVSGCDMQKETSYSRQFDRNIKVFNGHSQEHLAGVDLLVVSPAILYQNAVNPEYLEAKKKKIVLTWQEFLGRHLLKDKEVIAISGTHGKSTTTAMAGLLFEKANFDNGAVIGAIVKKWKSSFRYGKGTCYVVEADEFNDNFLNYHPETIIINNIEFDHPDYFKNESDVLNSFLLFVKRLKKNGNLIINQDSKGIGKLFSLLKKSDLKGTHVFGYSQFNKPEIKVEKSFKIGILKKNELGSFFKINGEVYNLLLPGNHNVLNAAGVVILSKVYGIDQKIVKQVLKNFDGLERRMDLIEETGGIKIYDDYAHHPSAIKVTLEALRQKYPNGKILALYEPHSYSRTKALLNNYRGVFDVADKVIIVPIFKARDKSNFGVSEESIVKASEHKNIHSFKSFNEVILDVIKNEKDFNVIIVMGAGKSYLLTKNLINSLKFYKNINEYYAIKLGEKMSNHTTVEIGGPATFFAEVDAEEKLVNLIKEAVKYKIPFVVIGDGSNLLVSDFGYEGLVLKFVTHDKRCIRFQNGSFFVSAGVKLQNFIDVVIDKGFSGVEAMSLIPGTVGGAICGNAGAYGQTISDKLMSVKILDGKKIYWLNKKDCGFSYRSSILKEKSLVILEAEFKFEKGKKEEIRKKANEIISIRKVKYPVDLKCPGSYFRNVISGELLKSVIQKIPQEKVIQGKIPAGYLMEAVGAKGQKQGGIKILESHGNMIVNDNKGTAKDFFILTSKYGKKVEEKFKIKLVPEVVFLGNVED